MPRRTRATRAPASGGWVPRCLRVCGGVCGPPNNSLHNGRAGILQTHYTVHTWHQLRWLKGACGLPSTGYPRACFTSTSACCLPSQPYVPVRALSVLAARLLCSQWSGIDLVQHARRARATTQGCLLKWELWYLSGATRLCSGRSPPSFTSALCFACCVLLACAAPVPAKGQGDGFWAINYRRCELFQRFQSDLAHFHKSRQMALHQGPHAAHISPTTRPQQMLRWQAPALRLYPARQLAQAGF